MPKSIPGSACPLCDPEWFDAACEQVPAAVLCKGHVGHLLGELMVQNGGFVRQQAWTDLAAVAFTGKQVALSFRRPLQWIAFDLKDAEQFLQVFTLAVEQLRKSS